MNGFIGLEITKNNETQPITPVFGFVGLEIKKVEKNYIKPFFGFVGVEVNLKDSLVTKINKNTKY